MKLELDNIKKLIHTIRKEAVLTELTTYDECVLKLCHRTNDLIAALEKAVEQRDSEMMMDDDGLYLKAQNAFNAELAKILEGK